jgi:hypothetical protein
MEVHMRKIILLSSLLVSSLFVGCAAEVEIVDDGALEGVNRQFVEEAACIEATLPANGCLDWVTVKTQTYEICLQADMQLTGLIIDPNSSCNGGSGTNVDVQYQCCPAAPPSPEPPKPPPGEPGVCTGGTLGDGTCQSYADFKMAAWELCKQAGADLVDLVLDNASCPDGETGSVAYKCCTPAPQPPPVPGVCTTGTLGDGTTCQFYDDYKLAAWEACNQAGATLYNLTIDTESCGNGEAKSMSYVCLSSGDYCP